jgi:very-short-patch-repair endonuclease
MTKIKLFCDYCGFEFDKEQKEIKRKLKLDSNSKFYCSLICAGYGKPKIKQIKYEEKICPKCHIKFTCNVLDKKTNRTFCSRECASSGSVSEKRIQAGRKLGLDKNSHTTNIVAASLRSREMWKYIQINNELIERKINYQFEYVIENSIFDLALIDLKILIEFDGPYHKWLESDRCKTELADNYGWKLIRIETEANEEIKINKIENIISAY